jgi:hypothetical protein
MNRDERPAAAREALLLPVYPVVHVPSLAPRPGDLQPICGAHEMSDEAAESSVRCVARLVPLAYAGLLGLTGGNLAAWIAAGVVASIAFDLSMGRHSLLRSVFRRLSALRRRPAVAAPLDSGRR